MRVGREVRAGWIEGRVGLGLDMLKVGRGDTGWVEGREEGRGWV